MKHALILLLFCAPINAQTVKALISQNLPVDTDRMTIVRFNETEFDKPITIRPLPGPGIGACLENCTLSLLQNGYFVAPMPGLYAVFAQIAYEENGNGLERSLVILKHDKQFPNGKVIAIVETSSAQIRPIHIIIFQAHGFAQLGRGEFLSVAAYQSSGNTLNVVAAHTWAVVTKL